ncbi:MAG: hypothetical protein GF381_04085 [Candidatus Pacebacteria bacterium]|nr:hypothetical protein [Candidatus Paceibacterota bacterium]
MNSLNNKGPAASKRPQSGGNNNNLFARALAEAEKRSAQNKGQQSAIDETMARAGQNLLSQDFGDFNFGDGIPGMGGGEDPEKQQQELEKQRKRKELQDKLHRKVNPVEQTEIFNAREENVKKEINEIRKELKALAVEIAKFYKEVDITLEQNVPSPGQTGAYHINFFQKLKQFIIFLRQKVRSARTWAKQMKAKKKKRTVRQGLDFGANEAKASHDMLHHERSNAYTGA